MPTIPPSVDRPAPGSSLPGQDAPDRAVAAGRPGWQTTAWWAWAEWMAHGRMVLGFLVGWLAVVWFLPLIAHP